jgi:hypothetical protein
MNQSPNSSSADLKWFRGQLHIHTYWSDGRGFPEQAVEAYRNHGYHFLAVTDHNRYGSDKNTWHPVAVNEVSVWSKEGLKIPQPIFDAYLQSMGKDWVETKVQDGVTYVRIKTIEETKSKMDEAGKFLLLPGIELTQILNGLSLHQNYINLPLIVPCVQDSNLIKVIDGPMSMYDLILLNSREAEHAAFELKRPYIFVLNHPFWEYYNITPQNLIDCSNIKFFEICNNGIDFQLTPGTESYDLDKFWDVVNAFRTLKGDQLLYGLASDDAHFYDPKRIKGPNGVDLGCVFVRANELSEESLFKAMHEGDFYSSTGVVLSDVCFNDRNKTLRVKVETKPHVDYKIKFVTTKKQFDQSVRVVKSMEVPLKQRVRDILCIRMILGKRSRLLMDPKPSTN